MSSVKLTKSEKNRIAGSDALFDASKDDLRVLICLMEDGTLSGEALAAASGCHLDRISGSIGYWKEAGILEQTGNGYRMKTYYRSGEEIRDAVERHGLGTLFDGCQSILSHTLNDTEISILVELVDDYRLASDYILTLLSYCVEINRGSIAFMRKVAVDWVEKGITTIEMLDVRIKGEKEQKTTEGVIRKIFGIRDRAFSKKELSLIAGITLYGYTEDVLGYVYDITVDATGKAALSYAASILEKWYKAGCQTLSDCEAQVEKEKAEKKAVAAPKKPSSTTDTGHSFVTGDFFQKALARSYAGQNMSTEDGKDTGK